jgi:hypothetical protein
MKKVMFAYVVRSVDEDHLVSGTRELAHQVRFGVRVVIPPVFATKTDNRTVLQHEKNH